MTPAERRARQLSRLEQVADLKARLARHDHGAAQRAEAAAARAIANLDARRTTEQSRLDISLAPDPALMRATDAFLRWALQERARLATNHAARRAEALTQERAAARATARHAVLTRLRDRN